MKSKHIEAYMRVAYIFSDLSSAVRLKVGVIIVKDDRVISIGYNGTPSGWDNCCEEEIKDGDSVVLVTKQEVMHAERNALDKLARGNESGLGATMFVTHSPCIECAKSIYGAGITHLFYSEDYRSDDGIKFLKKCGILVQQISWEK